jgi:hypothetical protein
MFHYEWGLFDNVTFRWYKDLVNKVGIPLFSGVEQDNIINSLNVSLVVTWGKDLVTILPSHPIVLPYVYMLAIAHLPTAALPYSVNSLIDALPSIARLPTLLSMENISVRVVFCL